MLEPEKDIGKILKESIFKKPYSEEKVRAILLSIGYESIEVDDIGNVKRFRMIIKNKMPVLQYERTLFVKLDKDVKVRDFEFAYQRKDEPENIVTNVMIAIVFLAVIGLVIWFVGGFFIDVIQDLLDSMDYDSDGSDFISDTDDKDFDGDVDFDDVEKNLNDSLEEDLNDGDD
ncbi:hypothetical protein MHH33_06950 [Paenisporosarcina sp. FSL H8-0542]|uniref:hypothetical protein n=1 Tax=Paenisporosarcina sp. FSL H8-0542 TaxID=2921401 RepID=UPI003159A0E4